jgi:hypothetical protein
MDGPLQRPATGQRPTAALWPGLLALAVGLLFVTAPRSGDFWWSDAPRHAMNGVFLMDFLKALPLDDPAGFAKSYYAQYPALSILFYPPLFPLVEAPVFGLFGVSHGSAQLAVALFWLALALGVFRLARRVMEPPYAFATALLLVSAHEIAYWGRQVMLEIPVYASMVWAALMYLRYLDTRQPRFLYATALFCLAALYTKQTAAFLVIALAALLLYETRCEIRRSRHFWLALGLGGLALLPLAFMTVKFGKANLDAGFGETGRELSRLSLDGWTFYFRQLPRQIGWTMTALAAAYGLGRRFWRLPAREERLLIAWFVLGYLFFSLIALKEVRHSLVILLPLIFFAVAALRRLLPPRLALPGTLALAAAYFAQAVLFDRPPAIGGYAQAAAFVSERAPANSLILFSGYRDGSFVFNVRALQARNGIGVLRSDKLLLKVKVKRELGVEQRGLSQEDLADALNRYGVSYVVNQPNFWDDLEAMRTLQRLLHSPQFVKVGEFPVTGDIPHDDRIIEIYRNVQYVPADKERPPLELLIVDQII